MGLSARVISGAFVGWLIATMHDGSGMFGAIAGIAGAVIGTYAGHAARLAAIARIGGYPAAIVENLVAIGLAAFHRHTLGPACILTPRIRPVLYNKEGNPMQRLSICCAAGLALLFGAAAPTPTSAYYYRHHHYNYYNNGHYYNNNHYYNHRRYYNNRYRY